MDKKKRQLSVKQSNNEKIIDSFDYLSNAASSQDCTGLIPSAPTNTSELESYSSIYHYLPPEIPSKERDH